MNNHTVRIWCFKFQPNHAFQKPSKHLFLLPTSSNYGYKICPYYLIYYVTYTNQTLAPVSKQTLNTCICRKTWLTPPASAWYWAVYYQHWQTVVMAIVINKESKRDDLNRDPYHQKLCKLANIVTPKHNVASSWSNQWHQENDSNVYDSVQAQTWAADERGQPYTNLRYRQAISALEEKEC